MLITNTAYTLDELFKQLFRGKVLRTSGEDFRGGWGLL